MISRAIAALPSTYLLSELHPRHVQGLYFNPLDPLQQFMAQYSRNEPTLGLDLDCAFAERLNPVVQAVEDSAGYLVLRDHSHSDWLVSTPGTQCSLLSALSGRWPIRSILTLRHPVEAYASMMTRNWHLGVGSFNEYCRRVLSFVEHFAETPMFHYEDFVDDPDHVLKQIAEALELPFSSQWRTTFETISLTGNSGRAGKSSEIGPLPMRDVTIKLREGAMKSEAYSTLCQRFGYTHDPIDLYHQRLQRARQAGGA